MNELREKKERKEAKERQEKRTATTTARVRSIAEIVADKRREADYMVESVATEVHEGTADLSDLLIAQEEAAIKRDEADSLEAALVQEKGGAL